MNNSIDWLFRRIETADRSINKLENHKVSRNYLNKIQSGVKS